MGMDVYGNNPTNDTGTYFRNNVWWWRPLWDYCCHVSPDIAGKVKLAHENSGDGLDNIDSIKLSMALDESINNGTAERYVLQYNITRTETIPCECSYVYENSDCAICNGTGIQENFLKYYHIDVDNIKKFRDFLVYSGGFKIL